MSRPRGTATITPSRNVVEVACPNCGAAVGVECDLAADPDRASGSVRAAHVGRIVAFMAQRPRSVP